MISIRALVSAVAATLLIASSLAVPSLPGSLLHFRRVQSPVLGLSMRYESAGASAADDLAGFHSRQRQSRETSGGNLSSASAGGPIHHGSLPFGAALELSFQAFDR